MIRENRIEHARLKKELDKLLHDLRVEKLAATLGFKKNRLYCKECATPISAPHTSTFGMEHQTCDLCIGDMIADQIVESKRSRDPDE